MLNRLGRLVFGLLALTLTASIATDATAAGILGDRNLVNDLVYDSTSGRVVIDVQDLTGTGPIVDFVLSTDQTFDLSDGLITTGLDCGLILPAVVCGNLSSTSITYADPSDTGFEGLLDLGRILPTGLSGPEVQGFLSVAQYKSINVDTYVEFDLLILPEPAACVLLLLGAGIARWRMPKRS